MIYYDEPDWCCVSFEYLQRECRRLCGLCVQPWLLRSSVSGVVRVSPDVVVAHYDGRLSREDLLAECLRSAAEDPDQPWDFRQGALKVLHGTWMSHLGYIAEDAEGYTVHCAVWCDTEHAQIQRAARNAQEAVRRAQAERLREIKAQLRAKARERGQPQTRLEDNPDVAAATEAQQGQTPRHIADHTGQWARQHAERAAARQLPDTLEEVYEVAFLEAATALRSANGVAHNVHTPHGPRSGGRVSRPQRPRPRQLQLQLQAQDGTLRLDSQGAHGARRTPTSTGEFAQRMREKHARGIAERAIRAAERLLKKTPTDQKQQTPEGVVDDAGGVDKFLELVA